MSDGPPKRKPTTSKQSGRAGRAKPGAGPRSPGPRSSGPKSASPKSGAPKGAKVKESSGARPGRSKGAPRQHSSDGPQAENASRPLPKGGSRSRPKGGSRPRSDGAPRARAEGAQRPPALGAQWRQAKPRPRPQAKRARPQAASDLPGERVQRLIARAGVASRRAAEELILNKRVRINGRIAELGDRAMPGDDVRVDGKQLNIEHEAVTYVLNKPAGYVTTARDERGRATVFDLLPPTPGLHSVGRLDRDSEGLLLLTTDGDLTLRLTHPRFELEKEYRVWTKQGRVDGPALKRLMEGVELDDGPAIARSARPTPGGAVVILTEGRKREVRRLFKALGYTVDRLVRVRVGTLKLGDLAAGAFREVTVKELRALGYNPAEREARPTVGAPQPAEPGE